MQLKNEDFSVTDSSTVKMPALWFYENEEETVAEQSSSGGGAFGWLLVFAGLIWLSRKKLLDLNSYSTD